MIRKYFDFLRESRITDKYHSMGEYIEKEFGDDEYALNIVSQHTKDIDPTIRLANAVNLLPEETQNLILDLITKHREGETEEPTEVTAYVDVNLSESVIVSGKNMFKCFMKVLTALGQKDTKPVWEKTPDTFLIFFRTIPIDTIVVNSVMSRYSYFDTFIKSIDYTHNECHLYYGIKTDGNFEYGISTDDQVIPVGQFRISKGIFNWLITLDSPSASNLKREMIGLDPTRLFLLGTIKMEMLKFRSDFQSQSQMRPEIHDGVITFGYSGVGRWNSGVMEPEDLDRVKQSVKTYLSKYRWSEKIQVSVRTGSNFWLFVNIRIK